MDGQACACGERDNRSAVLDPELPPIRLILIGLAIGGVLGHWLPAGIVIIGALVAAAINGWTGSRVVSLAMVAISALLLLYNAYS